jgi:hypothetical protein
MNHQRGDPVKQFGAGISSAISLLIIEIAIFMYDIVSKAMSGVVQTFPQSATTNPYLINFSSFIAFFVILGIVQSLIVGVAGSKPYVFGFLLGDAIILFPLAFWVWKIIPSVVIGMATGFLIVLGCLIVRLHLEKPKYDDRDYYP